MDFIARKIVLMALMFAVSGRAADLPRSWKNSLGTSIEATLLHIDGTNVSLLLDNGKIVTMAIENLSKPDQDFLHQSQKALAGPPPQTESAGTSQHAVESPNSPPQQGASLPAGETQQAHSNPDLLTQSSSPPSGIPDARVHPQAELYITFPELGMARNNEPVAMRVRIPAKYRPETRVPLCVWLAGGDGNSWFNEAANFLNKDDFVIAGLNYPQSAPEPRKASNLGQIDKVWEVQERMLAKLVRMVPNIDPRLRIVAGFSNGAHTIGGCLAQRVESLYQFFNVFILIEGGISNSYNYPALPGRYYYVAWGMGEGGRGNAFGLMLADLAKKAKMNVEAHGMEGVGHDFPTSEEQKVKSWLYDVVIPNQAPGI